MYKGRQGIDPKRINTLKSQYDSFNKIAVDAMGGDGSPKKIIDGIIHNHKSNKESFFKIFGDKDLIQKILI